MYQEIFDWLKTCPQLSNLWAISAVKMEWQDVLFLSSTTALYDNINVKYIDNNKRITMSPTGDYSETYEINAYRPYAEEQDSYNIDAYNQTLQACEWLIEQTNNDNIPTTQDGEIYCIEVLTPAPIIRGIDDESRLVGYYISIRVHRNNPAKRVDKII